MSKKDFQAIAAALYQTRPHGPSIESLARDVWERTRSIIADVLAASNPRFDRARFIEACETGKCHGMRQVR